MLTDLGLRTPGAAGLDLNYSMACPFLSFLSLSPFLFFEFSNDSEQFFTCVTQDHSGPLLSMWSGCVFLVARNWRTPCCPLCSGRRRLPGLKRPWAALWIYCRIVTKLREAHTGKPNLGHVQLPRLCRACGFSLGKQQASQVEGAWPSQETRARFPLDKVSGGDGSHQPEGAGPSPPWPPFPGAQQ